MISQFTAKTIEAALAKVITLDPDAALTMANLNGKSLAVKVEDLRLNYTFFFEGTTIQVSPDFDVQADARLSGRAIALMLLASTEGPTGTMHKGGISFQGSPQVLLACQQALKAFNFDLEGALAQYVGKIPANKAMRPARQLKQVAKKCVVSSRDDWVEFLTEEIHLVPPAEAVSDFCDEVDQLKQAVERLEARIGHYSSLG